MQQEVKSKISNPDRIVRIISRMCEGGMYALIRTEDDSKVGIRSNFYMVDASTTPQKLFFNGISEYGLEKIKEGESVRFEVIGMPSKVIFQANICKKLGMGGIVCDLPPVLISIERRAATRAPTHPNLMAYVKLGIWKPSRTNIGAPPVFGHHLEVFNWISVFDISIGGVCIRSHFPSLQSSLVGIDDDHDAQLILPMQEPIHIPVNFRWQKKIKNRHTKGGKQRYQLEYRMGLEYIHLGEQQLMIIKNFIRQLSVADAI